MKQMVFLRFDAAGFSVDRTAPRDPSSPSAVALARKADQTRAPSALQFLLPNFYFLLLGRRDQSIGDVGETAMRE